MRKELTAVLGAVVATFAIACQDRSSVVAPEHPASPAASLDRGGQPGAPASQYFPLHRTGGESEQSASFTVTPAGGGSAHVAGGLTVVVPAGAVTATTTITVTVVAGDGFAYRFQPEGLHFAKPIKLVQHLTGVTRRDGIVGLYFTGAAPQLDAGGTIIPAEQEPLTVDDRAHTATMSVVHFSGYTFASARSTSTYGY